MRWSLALALTLAATLARAKDKEHVIYEKHTVITFDEAGVIDGSLASPDVGYIEAQKHRRHKNLIRPRQDFRDEILKGLRF